MRALVLLVLVFVVVLLAEEVSGGSSGTLSRPFCWCSVGLALCRLRDGTLRDAAVGTLIRPRVLLLGSFVVVASFLVLLLAAWRVVKLDGKFLCGECSLVRLPSMLLLQVIGFAQDVCVRA